MNKRYKLPELSIIMATYNRSKLLKRAILSIINQTCEDFELIIVEGSSPDDSETVIKSFKDKRIRYVRQKENRGMLSARNIGLNLAKGKYVCFHDDDDELTPNSVQKVIDSFKELENKSVSIVFFDSMDSETKKVMHYTDFFEGFISYEDFLCEKVSSEFWPVIDRKIIGKQRFDERLWGVEGIFWLRLLKYHKAYYLPKALRIYYKDHGDNVCRFENQLKHTNQYVMNNQVFLKQFGEEQKALCSKAYGNRIAVLGFWQILDGQKKDGRRSLLKSLKYKFSLWHMAFCIASYFLSGKQMASIYKRLR